MYDSLEAIAREFLSSVDLKAQAACFGVAGPVVEGRATITNLPWVIDARQLAADLDLSAVYLLNDLESIANAVPILNADDLRTLNAGLTLLKSATVVVKAWNKIHASIIWSIYKMSA